MLHIFFLFFSQFRLGKKLLALHIWHVSIVKNSSRWPAKDDILTYELEDIIALVEPPVLLNQHYFEMNECQFADLCYGVSNI